MVPALGQKDHRVYKLGGPGVTFDVLASKIAEISSNCAIPRIRFATAPAAKTPYADLLEGNSPVALDTKSTPAIDALLKLLIGERAIVTFLRGVGLRRHAIIPLEIPNREEES